METEEKGVGRSKSLIYGVGVNDADYSVNPTVDDKRLICPFYRKWVNMLARCYSGRYQEKYPSYKGCSVDKEWHLFMIFKGWMEEQDWRDKHLDKDLLLPGNKVYSPTMCVFVSREVNNFTIDRENARGECLLGVYWNKDFEKYHAQCNNPFTKKGEHLGYFTTQEEGHLAWKQRKHELACLLADKQTDERVAQALRIRYL